MKDKKLQKQADAILKQAEEVGLQGNFLFTTTFKRYLVQLDMLDKLEDGIKDLGALVTKEYVRGRENLYTNPAVSEFNRTTDSANKTVSTLMRILKNLGEGEKDDVDPLMEVINGDGE